MAGLALIAFAKRQAPDWAGVEADYRRGLAIDPARYVPRQAIPGSGLQGWQRAFDGSFIVGHRMIVRRWQAFLRIGGCQR